ncbi:hypothetical protein V6N13_071273 [Hibiscus sabdariffa]
MSELSYGSILCFHADLVYLQAIPDMFGGCCWCCSSSYMLKAFSWAQFVPSFTSRDSGKCISSIHVMRHSWNLTRVLAPVGQVLVQLLRRNGDIYDQKWQRLMQQ